MVTQDTEEDFNTNSISPFFFSSRSKEQCNRVVCSQTVENTQMRHRNQASSCSKRRPQSLRFFFQPEPRPRILLTPHTRLQLDKENRQSISSDFLTVALSQQNISKEEVAGDTSVRCTFYSGGQRLDRYLPLTTCTEPMAACLERIAANRFLGFAVSSWN